MSKLTHSTNEGMDATDLRRAIEDGNEDLLPPVIAPAVAETRRTDVAESPPPEIFADQQAPS